jgi:hypothetical protein
MGSIPKTPIDSDKRCIIMICIYNLTLNLMTRAKSSCVKRGRMGEDSDLLELILKLRFGRSDMCNFARPILSYTAIAKVLGKPISTIRYLALKAIALLKLGLTAKMRPRRSLDKVHIEYLLSKQTLGFWAHLSLSQRS